MRPASTTHRIYMREYMRAYRSRAHRNRVCPAHPTIPVDRFVYCRACRQAGALRAAQWQAAHTGPPVPPTPSSRG